LTRRRNAVSVMPAIGATANGWGRLTELIRMLWPVQTTSRQAVESPGGALHGLGLNAPPCYITGTGLFCAGTTLAGSDVHVAGVLRNTCGLREPEVSMIELQDGPYPPPGTMSLATM
jgi:hypothetical protein